jgi:hypothetical protein
MWWQRVIVSALCLFACAENGVVPGMHLMDGIVLMYTGWEGVDRGQCVVQWTHQQTRMLCNWMHIASGVAFLLTERGNAACLGVGNSKIPLMV